MRQSRPRAYRSEPATTVVELGQARQQNWPVVTTVAVPESARPRRAPTVVERRPVPLAPLEVAERVTSGVHSLVHQVRALQERYQEEHRRLADTLEFLAVQRQDLERELEAFAALVGGLQGAELPAAETGVSATPRRIEGNGKVSRPPIRLATQDRSEEPRILEVRCLGGFEVFYQGQPVDLGSSRNGRLIFKYLATRAPGHRAAKELLAELFWPDTPLDRALPSLQSAVHQLRRATRLSVPELGRRPAILFAGDHYALNPDLALRSDIELFRERIQEARITESRNQAEIAAALYLEARQAYRGEFLPDDRYEDWVIQERGALEAEYLELLSHLLQLQLQQGAYQNGIEIGQELIRIDNTREDAHRDLMRCYSRSGQRTAALRQYRACFEALEAELDLTPEPATEALYELLVRGEVI
jgi:DNA-binding SARP family transcriptional activator